MNTHSTLKDVYALVTGSSSGIGEALSWSLARRGYNLVLVARREERLKTLAKTIEETHHVTVQYIVCDLTNDTDRAGLVDVIRNKTYPLEILVNNAGMGDIGWFIDSDANKQEAIVDLNIQALVHLTHAALPVLESMGGGYVLNVGSVAGFLPGPFMATYYASKNFVLAFTEGIHEEMRRRNTNVTVSVLCPGPTQSEFGQVAGVLASKEKNMMKTLFSNRRMIPSAEQVAEYGITHLLRKKCIIVHGTAFKVANLFTRVASRSLIRRIVARLQLNRV